MLLNRKLFMARCLKFGCTVLVISFLRKSKFEIFVRNQKLYTQNNKEKKKEFYRCQRCIHNSVKHLRWSFLLKLHLFCQNADFHLLNASGCSQTTCCAKQLPQIGKYSLKLVRLDILKYRRVIWGPMGVFIAKQGDIMSHWGSVGVIARSVGLNGAYWGLAGGQ